MQHKTRLAPSLSAPVSQDGWTPLHVAARDGHAEAVAVLVAARADVHAKAVSRQMWGVITGCGGLDTGKTFPLILMS